MKSCNNGKKWFIGAIVILLLCVFPGTSWAERRSISRHQPEATFIFDESDDQLSYGEKVAQQNRKQQMTGPVDGSETPADEVSGKQATVLCRTDGTSIDFRQWTPAFIAAGPNDCYTLYFDDGLLASRACRDLSATAGIRYAEKDQEVYACGNREISFHSWGAQAMNYASYLSYSSDWRDGSATVAIVDSGVYLHPLLEARVLESGYDYIDADYDSTNDLFGHGTNVAGIVADCTYGANVLILPIRVLDAGGRGSVSNVVNAIREATDRGVQVINLSLEVSGISEALDEAIEDAIAAGITVVAAAGNKSIDTANVSPAHMQNQGVIVVGSAEIDRSRSSYSNYGSSVDLYTYGTAIECCSRSGGYTTATGTSMAAPHVSALASLIVLMHPEDTPVDIENRIVSATVYENDINIPDLGKMIPENFGFSLQNLRTGLQDRIRMPQTAYPETSLESIVYVSSDPSVLTIENGTLVPIAEGSAVVTASCIGLQPCSFTVTVETDEYGVLVIPSGVKHLADEAFFGVTGVSSIVMQEGLEDIGDRVFGGCTALRTVRLPGTVNSIGENDFSGAVLLCTKESMAADYAVSNGFAYILVTEEQGY